MTVRQIRSTVSEFYRETWIWNRSCNFRHRNWGHFYTGIGSVGRGVSRNVARLFGGWTTSHSYNSCSFGGVNDHWPRKENTQKKKTQITDWPGLKTFSLWLAGLSICVHTVSEPHQVSHTCVHIHTVDFHCVSADPHCSCCSEFGWRWRRTFSHWLLLKNQDLVKLVWRNIVFLLSGFMLC